jgi:hypothetical protein
MIGQVYAPAALASGTHEVGDRCCRAFWTWWRDGKSETGGNLGSSLGYKRLLIRVLRTFQNSFISALQLSGLEFWASSIGVPLKYVSARS